MTTQQEKVCGGHTAPCVVPRGEGTGPPGRYRKTNPALCGGCPTEHACVSCRMRPGAPGRHLANNGGECPLNVHPRACKSGTERFAAQSTSLQKLVHYAHAHIELPRSLRLTKSNCATGSLEIQCNCAEKHSARHAQLSRIRHWQVKRDASHAS